MPESLFTHDDPNARSEDPDVELGNEPDAGNRLPLPLTSGEVGKRTKTESIAGSRASSAMKWIKKLQMVVDALSAMTSQLVAPFMAGTNLNAQVQIQLRVLILEGESAIAYLATLENTLIASGTLPLYRLLNGKYHELCLFITPMLAKQEAVREEPTLADPAVFDAFAANDRSSGIPRAAPQVRGFAMSPHAFNGIDLLIRAPSQFAAWSGVLASKPVANGNIGLYVITARVVGDSVLYFVGRSVKRDVDEWMIGPAMIDQFTADQQIHDTKAKQLLSNEHIPSVLEQEALTENAPWQERGIEQTELGTGKRNASEPTAIESAGERREANTLASSFHQGMTMAAMFGNGAAINSLYNSSQRLFFYQRNARKLSEKILQDFRDGKVASGPARSGAVEGRNKLLYETRSKITPSQRKGSEIMKEDGLGVTEIENRAAGDLPAKYAGYQKYRKGDVQGKLKPKDLDRVRNYLDLDSPEWKVLSEGMAEAGDPSATRAARTATAQYARANLRGQPAVTEAVIKSAGRGNPRVNLLAKGAFAYGALVTAAELEQLIVEVIDADEADRLRVASVGTMNLAGAMIGGELGATIALTLLASSLTGPMGVFIVSAIGSAAGAYIGQEAANQVATAVFEGGDEAGGLLPSSMAATKGGFSGMQAEADDNVLHRRYTLEKQVEDQIYTIDGRIAALEARGLDTQAKRLRADLIDDRAPLEQVLTLIRLGMFDYGDVGGDE